MLAVIDDRTRRGNWTYLWRPGIFSPEACTMESPDDIRSRFPFSRVFRVLRKFRFSCAGATYRPADIATALPRLDPTPLLATASA